jgi:hypothetical protein
MRPDTSSLEFTVIWNDSSLQEVVVSASSELFSGKVHLYAAPGELKNIAERLRGFPKSQDDKREFTLGQNHLPGYGRANLTLYCKDATGHVTIEVALHSHPIHPNEGAESAMIHIPAVIGDIDRFAAELRSIDNQVGASALLRSAA